ncbi:hypothetical protein CGCSCA1_v013298 [Colletotrichum siamense]|nr:hypothetical protein CGCSCA1_v013298 [Colletotrichum siamense]
MKDVQNGGKVVAMAKAWEVRLQKELPRLRDFQRSVPENAGQPEDPVNVGRFAFFSKATDLQMDEENGLGTLND